MYEFYFIHDKFKGCVISDNSVAVMSGNHPKNKLDQRVMPRCAYIHPPAAAVAHELCVMGRLCPPTSPFVSTAAAPYPEYHKSCVSFQCSCVSVLGRMRSYCVLYLRHWSKNIFQMHYGIVSVSIWGVQPETYMPTSISLQHAYMF